ncbi:hypothetical protein LB505_009831 [Fusarium chuoi]|nr:hypothetical protein LB505_009831 [Fusarium chuoi]
MGCRRLPHHRGVVPPCCPIRLRSKSLSHQTLNTVLLPPNIPRPKIQIDHQVYHRLQHRHDNHRHHMRRTAATANSLALGWMERVSPSRDHAQYPGDHLLSRWC